MVSTNETVGRSSCDENWDSPLTIQTELATSGWELLGLISGVYRNSICGDVDWIVKETNLSASEFSVGRDYEPSSRELSTAMAKVDHSGDGGLSEKNMIIAAVCGWFGWRNLGLCTYILFGQVLAPSTLLL